MTAHIWRRWTMSLAGHPTRLVNAGTVVLVVAFVYRLLTDDGLSQPFIGLLATIGLGNPWLGLAGVVAIGCLVSLIVGAADS